MPRLADAVGLRSDTPSLSAPSRPRLEGVRVAIVLKWSGFGGAERQALLVARHLRDVEGAAVEVQALGQTPGRAIEMFRDAGIPWHGRPGRWRGSRKRTIPRLARAAAALRRARPDVLLPYLDIPNVVCGLVWRLTGARTSIWNQRDALPFHLDDEFVRLAIRMTPTFVSNSGHGAELLAAMGAPRDRIRVIRNGVSLAPARDGRPEWRRRLGVGENDVVVTSLAHFYPRKDHETLLAAWRRTLTLVDADGTAPTLVLAGRSEGRREPLEALACDLGVDGRVRFVGDVDDVAGLLAASEVGVLSSSSGEGCANAVLETMAAGLPVAGTDLPGIREALGAEGRAFLVPCGDADALGAALARLCSDPSLRTREGARNEARAGAMFGAERMLEDTVLTILDELERARAPRRRQRRRRVRS